MSMKMTRYKRKGALGTATEKQVRKGKTFSNSAHIGLTGELVSTSKNVVGSIQDSLIEGLHEGTVIAGEPNLLPENILKGISVFGVEGIGEDTVKFLTRTEKIGRNRDDRFMVSLTGLPFQPKFLIGYFDDIACGIIPYNANDKKKEYSNYYISVRNHQGVKGNFVKWEPAINRIGENGFEVGDRSVTFCALDDTTKSYTNANITIIIAG